MATGFLQVGAQIEVPALEVELAGLDLGKVKDVVDDGQQTVCRGLDHPEVLPLLTAEIGIEGQLGHADDAVHGGSDLVAHVGQELALGPAGRFGRFLGLLQGGFGPRAVENFPFSSRRSYSSHA